MMTNSISPKFIITCDKFITDVLNAVNDTIGTYVASVYSKLSTESNVITAVFTVYIIYFGYQFITRSLTVDLFTIMKKLVVMLCAYGLFMNWDIYNTFFYNVFTNEPDSLAKIMMAVSNGTTDSSGVNSGLDSIFSNLVTISLSYWAHAGFSGHGIEFAIYGLVVLILGVPLCIVALLLFIYAKVTMAVLLALGPIFVLFILWDSTRGLFNNWINNLVTIALIPIITSAILALMLTIIQSKLPNPITAKDTDLPDMFNIAMFIALSWATILVLTQVLNLASALGSGITTATMKSATNTTKSIAGSMIKTTGVPLAAKIAKAGVSAGADKYMARRARIAAAAAKPKFTVRPMS